VLSKDFDLARTPYYVITHPALAPVGRIIIGSVPDHQTRLDAEVAGAPTDPAFDRRRKLVDQVFKEVQRVISYGLLPEPAPWSPRGPSGTR